MQDSLLSSSSGFRDFSGFLNLFILLLFISHFRLVLDNFLQHGFLVDPTKWFALLVSAATLTPMRLLYASNFFLLFALFVEKLRAKRVISFLGVRILITLNLVLLLLLPTAVILLFPPHPIAGCFICGVYTILFLKLVSYASVNEWCFDSSAQEGKRARRSLSTSNQPNLGQDEDVMVTYPNNLNLKDLYFFVLAPTLCYEVNFPRSPKRRLWFLLYRVTEMIFLTQLMLGLVQQSMLPIVNVALKPFDDMDNVTFVEQILTLAIWNHFLWLFFFYWLFHSSLNVLAEILRFGDRDFYRDWWNSDNIEQFWQKWNIPIHRWCVRHLYKPLLRRGSGRLLASVAVFFLSAFFHEFLVSVPLNMFRLWSFMGMLGQIPVGYIIRLFPSQMGGMGLRNALVWMSIIMGQPIAIFMYFHDYYVKNMTSNNVS